MNLDWFRKCNEECCAISGQMRKTVSNIWENDSIDAIGALWITRNANGNKALTTLVKTIMENLCDFFPVRLFHHGIGTRCLRTSKVSADDLGRTPGDLLSWVWAWGRSTSIILISLVAAIGSIAALISDICVCVLYLFILVTASSVIFLVAFNLSHQDPWYFY